MFQSIIIILFALVNFIICQSTLSTPGTNEPFPWENEFPNSPNIPSSIDGLATISPSLLPPNNNNNNNNNINNVNSTSNPLGSAATAIYFPGYTWNQAGGNWSNGGNNCNNLHGIARFICQLLPRFFLDVQADGMNE